MLMSEEVEMIGIVEVNGVWTKERSVGRLIG